MNTEQTQGRWRDAVQNFSALLAEIQPFLNRASDAPAQTAAALRRDAAGRIKTAEKRLQDLQEAAERTAKSPDRFVRERPWTAIAGGALLGVAAGVVISQYRRKNAVAGGPGGSGAPDRDDPASSPRPAKRDTSSHGTRQSSAAPSDE
jgi:ElaB/YqjD/DUF883 family membrane-anchored ribosome-binding protein